MRNLWHRWMHRSPDGDGGGAPAVPAASAAPVVPAAAPAAPAQEPVGPSVSAVQRRLAEARAAMATGKTLADVVKDMTPHHSEEQPRAADGTFQPPVAPAEGAVPADPAAAGETATPPAAAGGDAPAAGETGAPAADDRLITLPALSDSEAAIELEIEDPRAQERIRALLGNVELRRVSEARLAQARAEREEVDEIRDMAYADPGGLVLDELSPEMQMHLARYLITREEIWQVLGEEILEYRDDTRRRQAALQTDEERSHLSKGAAEVLTQRQALRENSRQLWSGVRSLVPRDWTPQQRSAFERESFGTIERYIRDNQLRQLDPKFLPVVLDGVLTKHQLDPAAALAALRNGGQPPRPAPVRTTARVAVKPATGAEFVAGEARRRAAAPVPGVSAGAVPATRTAPPPKQTVEQRIAWMRENRGRAASTGA